MFVLIMPFQFMLVCVFYSDKELSVKGDIQLGKGRKCQETQSSARGSGPLLEKEVYFSSNKVPCPMVSSRTSWISSNNVAAFQTAEHRVAAALLFASRTAPCTCLGAGGSASAEMWFFRNPLRQLMNFANDSIFIITWFKAKERKKDIAIRWCFLVCFTI